jgi:hypothetical protein
MGKDQGSQRGPFREFRSHTQEDSRLLQSPHSQNRSPSLSLPYCPTLSGNEHEHKVGIGMQEMWMDGICTLLGSLLITGDEHCRSSQFGKPATVLGKNLLCRYWGLVASRARGHADSWVRYGMLLNWGGLDSVLSAVEPFTGFYYRYFFTPPYPLNYNFSLNLLLNNANMTLNLWRIHDVLL